MFGLRGSPTSPAAQRPAAPAGNHAAIQLSQVRKSYGTHVVLRGTDLSVCSGERVALLGQNGAGKTTLLRILALLTRPTAGTIEIAGLDGVADAQEIRARIGVSLHDSLLYSELTVIENLTFFGKLYHVEHPAVRARAILERLGLSGLERVRVRHLSRGQRQRASLARALVHDPPILLLDEPDTGQDLASLQRMEAELVSESHRTLVFATHRPTQALAIATRVMLLAGGRSKDLGPSESLTAGDLERSLLATTR